MSSSCLRTYRPLGIADRRLRILKCTPSDQRSTFRNHNRPARRG
jgi:hypothetical protein